MQPRALSITQSTELGTRYPLEAVRELADWAHGRGLAVHMDGARLANAAAGLGVPLGEASAGCGVDVLSFGGTKNGGLGAEAVVVLRPGLGADLLFRRKQGMQLASKMRYAAAQFVALLTDDLWRRTAVRANETAARLAAGAAEVPGVKVTRPVEANAVFAILPARRGRAAAGGVPVLRLGRGDRRGALDDLVRDHRRRGGRLRRHPGPARRLGFAACHGWSSTSR